MIYLIGGAPRVGKSIIAKQFVKSIKGLIVSTDEVENKLEKTHQVSPFFTNDASKNTLTPNERVKILIDEAGLLHNDINNIIQKIGNSPKDVVIEGVHLLPRYIDNLIKTFSTKNIKSIFIGTTDIEGILQGMAHNTGPNNWLKDFNEDVLRQIALFTKTFSQYLLDETKKFDLPYKERSNNFQKDTLDIIKKLTI